MGTTTTKTTTSPYGSLMDMINDNNYKLNNENTNIEEEYNYCHYNNIYSNYNIMPILTEKTTTIIDTATNDNNDNKSIVLQQQQQQQIGKTIFLSSLLSIDDDDDLKQEE